MLLLLLLLLQFATVDIIVATVVVIIVVAAAVSAVSAVVAVFVVFDAADALSIFFPSLLQASMGPHHYVRLSEHPRLKEMDKKLLDSIKVKYLATHINFQ